MKSVKAISEPEKVTLEEAMRNITDYRTRTRAHAILLSAKGFSITEVCKIYGTDRNTVSIWYDRCEKLGIIGIFDSHRTGRPKILTSEEENKVLKHIESNPRNLKAISAEIQKETGKSPSIQTIKRIAKAAGLVWKRIQKSLKNKRNEEAFQKAKDEIKQLIEQQKSGEIDVLFFDESGFTLEPVVPYAWQPEGQTIIVPSSKSKRLNVLGFMNHDGSLTSYVFDGSITSNEVIACFDAISAQCFDKPTWIIIDNSPIHTSKTFKAKINEWETKNLYIKNIPAYSPELNFIEILWKHIKYFWLPFSAYESFEALKASLNDILENAGTKYQITFA